MDAARDHMLVLIDEQKELLQALLREEGLLHSRKEDGRERVLSRERAAEIVEILEGDADKASRLEITLAVAGTVKAGKSTAVNAIIGTEALPNRARPMTALPTVIRHEAERFVPRLTVNNAAALNGLACRIACKLQDNRRLDAVRNDHKVDMEALIDNLAEGGSAVFDKEYEGRDQVFEALGRINDLLRLGRHVDVGEALAIEEYDDLDEMPAVTVHFHCLADPAQQEGSLALLDLPGFNEAQLSEHLTDVLEEQLEKASAILVVLDYTQLNTEASEELEWLLDAVSKIMRGRIFVLVNKFDERTSRDPDAAETKTHICADVLNGVVDPEHVFPVSAQRAYLASRALDALARNRALPSADDEPWVDDFRKLVFPFDSEKLEDLTEVNRVAGSLWTESGFEPMLNNVVVAAQQRAGELVLQSTLEKLTQYGADIEDHLELSARSLTTKVEGLENTIRSMSESIQAAEKVRSDFDTRIGSAMKGIDHQINKIMSQAKKMVRHNIENKFDEEVQKIIDAKPRKGTEIETEANRTKAGWWHELFPSSEREEDIRDWAKLIEEFKNNGKLEYDDEEGWSAAWSRIKEVYAKVAAQILIDASSSIKTLMKQTHGDLERELKKGLGYILEAARGALGDGGMEVKLRVPNFEPGECSGKPSAIRLRKMSDTRVIGTKTVVTHRLADFLDPFDLFGWGKEEVGVKVKVYVIEREKVIEALNKGVADTLGSYRQQTEAGIKDWRRHAKDNFDGIRNYLDRYHQSLVDGLAVRNMEREGREQILAVVQGMKKRSDDSRANLGDFQTVTGPTQCPMMAAREDKVMSRGDGRVGPLSEDMFKIFPQLREKAVVDVVNGLEIVDDHLRWRDENPGSFLDRLWNGLTGASARRQQAVDRGVHGVLRGMNEWLQGLQAAQAESDIAMARVAERLLETRHGVTKLQERHRELREQVALLDRRLEEHIERTATKISALQRELDDEKADRQAWNAVSDVNARWRTSRFEAVPPLLRVLLAANDLYWSKFGAFLRLKGPDDRDARKLIDYARNVLANMAADFAAGEQSDSLIVDRWLDPLEDTTLPADWRDALAYLLEGASPEEQPLVVSARMRLRGWKEELPRNRPRLVQPSYLGELVMRETVQRIESDWLHREETLG